MCAAELLQWQREAGGWGWGGGGGGTATHANLSKAYLQVDMRPLDLVQYQAKFRKGKIGVITIRVVGCAQVEGHHYPVVYTAHCWSWQLRGLQRAVAVQRRRPRDSCSCSHWFTGAKYSLFVMPVYWASSFPQTRRKWSWPWICFSSVCWHSVHCWGGAGESSVLPSCVDLGTCSVMLQLPETASDFE